jgi:adenylate cyclase
VIVEEQDIFGDGVNVAARLEALAVPGGVCISRMVRDQIRDKLSYPFEDIREQSVKNIARPVRVYGLRPEGIAGLSSTVSGSAPVPTPRMSIVVLPFTNLSDDREQQYSADGITEDVTTDLSRLPDMLVISRNTAFTYKDKRVETKQIGRELCVHYVLEGSVRRSGNHVRVNAQLIDAETDAHLWAERVDGSTSDLFALQDEITIRLANALRVELIAAEATRPTEHPEALDYILRGRVSRPYSRDSLAEAIGMYERALTLDPRSVAAQSCLALVLAGRVLAGMAASAAADIARAEELIENALASSPRSSVAHEAKGHVLRVQGRFVQAITEYETALASNRNRVAAIFGIAQCKLSTGSIEETIPLAEQAIRLSPRDPELGAWYYFTGRVHLMQSRIDQAISWLEKARSAMPAHPVFRATLASAYALNGETELAAAELAEVRRLSDDGRFTSIARLKAAIGTDFRGAEDPRLGRSHVFRRPAPGRDAGGVSAARLVSNVRRSLFAVC